MIRDRVEDYLVKCVMGPSYNKDEAILKEMKE